MMDHNDLDDISMVGFFTEGPAIFIVLILFAIVFFIVQGNEKECKAKSCPANMKAILAENQCLCVTEAK